MRLAMRISAGSLVFVLLSVALLLLTARFASVPLGPLAPLVSAQAEAAFPGSAVEMDAPRLGWSQQSGLYALTVKQLQVTDPDGAAVALQDIEIALSGRALREKRQLAVAAATVGKLQVTPSQREELPQSLGLLLPAPQQGGGDLLTYLQMVSVRDIVIDRPVAGRTSNFLLLKQDGALTATADIAYPSGTAGDRISSLSASARLVPGQAGHADILLDQVNPRDIARFSQLFAPLQAVRLPVTATLGIDFDGDGRPLRSSVNLFVEPGELVLPDAALPIAELNLSVEADFAAQRVGLTDARFRIAGVAGRMIGHADYALSADGRLKHVDFDLDGDGFSIDRPKLFSRKLSLDQVKALMRYDAGMATLQIDRLSGAHNYGKIDLAGAIGLADSQPHFDFTAGFGAMSRAGLDVLWPLPIAPNARRWAEQNVIGGKIVDAGLRLDVGLKELVGRKRGTPLREDALQLDVTVDDVSVRFLKGMPPYEGERVTLSLGGTGFRADSPAGRILLPDAEGTPQAAALRKLSFVMPDYRDRQAASDIRFAGSGSIADVVRAVGKPPLNVTRNIDFDFDRIAGKADFEVALSVPVFAKPEDRRVSFDVSAVSRDVDIAGELGPFRLSDADSEVSITNAGMKITGRGKANGVPLGFAWQQPFGKDGAEKSRLSVQGPLSPQQAADLGFAWVGQRFTGAVEADVLVLGNIARPKTIRVAADLTQAGFSPRPLAYEKPKDTPARLSVVIDNDGDGKMQALAAQLTVDGKKQADVKLGFDGPLLTSIDMQPLSLGRDRNLTAALQLDGTRRYVTLQADRFDVKNLFRSFNPQVRDADDDAPFSFLPFLGPDMIAEGQIEEIVGANKAELSGVKMRLIREDGLHEKLSLDGVFKNGASLIASLDRASPQTRDFALQTENAGELLRLFDWQREVYGGVLLLQGTMFDAGVDRERRDRDVDGRVTMVGFRARNVPVLASIFSLASLSGITDTLSGEGIKFRKLQSDFSLNNSRLNIEDGLVHGPAIGFTVQGDYDFGRGDIDIGGTLVPAYTINSFFGKIPLLGRILGGRRGEGVVGIGYRVSGEGGKANVLVNPLSVLTPGVFRRIFELGIGLPDVIDEQIPDFPQEEIDFPDDGISEGQVQ